MPGGGAAPLSKETSNNLLLSPGKNGFASSLGNNNFSSSGSSASSPSSSAARGSRASSSSSILYSSSGVSAHTLTHLQAQGELQRTDQPLDLAFDGDGLLLVRDKSGTFGGARTGTFHLTKEGRLQDAKGLTLQGWPLLPGDGAAGSSTGKTTGAGVGVSAPGGTEGPSSGSASAEDLAGSGSAGTSTTGISSTGPGSTSIGIGTSGVGTLLSSSPIGSAAQTAKTVAPPPSAAFVGSLGGLEDIQLIKPEPAPPPEAPDLTNPYGTGWSTQKEADGLYSFHGSEVRMGWDTSKETCARRTFVDSLGQEREVEMMMNLDTAWWETRLSFASGQFAWFSRELVTGYDTADNGCTLDEAAKQIVITFEDTGAELRFDLSDLAMIDADPLQIVSGGALPWRAAPMICEEGTYKMRQELIFDLDQRKVRACLTVERNEDGSFTGRLFYESLGFNAELYFDEEGQVSGYKFTKNGGSTSDPSVGVKQTGAIVKGVHFVDTDNGGIDLGTIDIDLRFAQILNRTDANLVVDGSAIKPKASEPKAVSEESKAGFVPLSPSSLSIDENGVLRRLKDNGDWEPVYLLACAQFAAMNAAEEQNGVYYATPASGALKTGASGKDGMGTIISGTLERSTTDLAHELSEMIKAQHAYAANTKVLSTLDDMLTELERL